MNTLPLIAINILSYNRKDELRFTLTKIYEQDYKNIEVIVVDNASSDGTPKMVEEEFPHVKLIKLDKNIGIGGWNKGFEAAKGEYVLVLDDDSYPEKGAILAGVQQLSSNPKVAVIGFSVYNNSLQIYENDEYYYISKNINTEITGFIGCGALIRKSIFTKLGGFDSNMFLYYNELDISARALNDGYQILFDRDNKVIHTYSTKTRNGVNKKSNIIDERRFYYGFQSYFIFLYKNFSYNFVLIYSLKLIVSRFYISLRLRYFGSYLKAITNIFIMLSRKEISHKPLKKRIQMRYNYGNMKFNDIYIFHD